MSKYLFGLRMPVTCWVLLLVWGLMPQTVQAHGEVHELIDALTKRIAAHPDSTELYLKRGVLYQSHGDFDLALADFQQVKFKAPDLNIADLRIASLLTDQGHFHSGLVFIDHYLAQEPNNVSGLQVRALIYSGLQKEKLALQDRIAALENADPRGPEFFLDVARAVLKVDPNDDEQALAWLDRGLKESGFLTSLADFAVSIEVEAGKYEAALARVEDIILRIPGSIQWMVARGEILALAGRELEAQQAYGAALLKIEALPADRRNTENMQNLERTVRGILRLQAPR